MGFRKGAYASCWSVEEGRGNTMKVRLSTSRKNKDGEYEQDFSGFCTFIGTAKAKAEKLKEKDRIRLGDVDVTTWYNKEKGVEYVTYKVFDFEMANAKDGATQQSDAPAPKKTAKATKKSALDELEDGGVDEDDLPF